MRDLALYCPLCMFTQTVVFIGPKGLLNKGIVIKLSCTHELDLKFHAGASLLKGGRPYLEIPQ